MKLRENPPFLENLLFGISPDIYSARQFPGEKNPFKLR
jgi:hypothetical protein